jgi:hypothetical protein
MDHAKHNTRQNQQTTEIFRPNKWQVLGSAYYVPRPRRRISPLRWLLAAIALLCLAYIGTYFVLVRVLG